MRMYKQIRKLHPKLPLKYMLKVETVTKESQEQSLQTLRFKLIKKKGKEGLLLSLSFPYSVNDFEILNILKLFTE